MLETEYRCYRIGCNRLGIAPVEREEFASRWQELEDYAGVLSLAETSGTAPETEPETRMKMQQTMKSDPFVRALLVGMAEEQSI